MFCMQSSPARPRDICMPGEQARSETGFTSHLSWPTFFAGLAVVPSPRVRFALLLQKLEKRRGKEGPDQLASSLSQFRYRRGGGTDCSSGERASIDCIARSLSESGAERRRKKHMYEWPNAKCLRYGYRRLYYAILM